MAKKKTTAQKQLEKAKADYAQSLTSGFNSLNNTRSVIKGNGAAVKEPTKGPVQTSFPAVKTKDGDVKITATKKEIAQIYKNQQEQKVYENTQKNAKTTTSTTKAPPTSEKKKEEEVIGSLVKTKINDTYARYGINPDTFSLEDLGKWAHDNNFQLTINQTTMEREYVPKKKGGFLGIGGEKLTTEQAERDLPTLKALAENNLRKTLVKNEGYRKFMQTADAVTLGLSTMYQTAEAKKDYKNAGLNQTKEPYANKFVSPEEAITAPVGTEGAGAWAKNYIGAGLSQTAKGIAATLDAVIPTDALGDYDWFSYMNNRFNNNQAAYQYGADAASGGNKYAKLGGQAIQMAVSALPQTALALMSGGTSAAGTLLPSAATTSNVLAEVGKSMARNPLYWSSVMSTVGVEYEEALEKGASEMKAATAAVLSSLINAGIEVGGGIEALPNKTGGFLKTIRDAALEEGSEEVWQGMISRGMAKAVYDSDKELFSFNNPDAVINPVTSAKEFAGGAFVGGLFGGATGGMNQIVQNQQTASTIKNIKNDPSRMGIVRELYRNGFRNTETDADLKTADAIIRMTSNSATQADMNMVENSEAAQKIVKILADDYTLARDVREASGWKPYAAAVENTKTVKQEPAKAENINTETISEEKAETIKPIETKTVASEPVREETAPIFEEETNVNYNETAPAAENLSSEAFGKTAGQIVQNEASEEMKRLQPKAYSNIENMAKELGTRVTFAKGLVNEKGQKLDGKIDGDGIVINTEAEDPIRFAATHEFGHRMKQLDPDAWGKYQDHVIKYWQKQGTYDVKMRALKNVYGKSMNTESLHEELACDFGEQMFRNEKTLSEFIKKDRTLAEKVKDVWFKVLSAFSDKARLRHAQNLWAKAYREAAGKVDGSGEFGKTKYSFAGENAKTANIATLNTAKEMEINGESEETIWKETGWSKGPDRKWRFEINDIDSFLIENPTVNLHKDIDGDYYTGKLPDVLNHEELFKAYPSLRTVDVIIQETEPGIGGTAFPKSNQIVLSETLFRKLSSEYEELINNRQKYIDEIEATPEYKKYNAIYEIEDGKIPPEEWLKLEKEARDKFFSSELGKKYYQLVWGKDKNVKKYEIGWSEKAKEALIHEIEHLIQYKEGFASGASVKYWQKQLDKGFDSRTKEEKKTLAKLQNEFYELIKTDPEFFREMEKLTSMKPDVPRGAINWETLEKIEEDPIEWKNYDKKLNELEEKFGAEKVSKFILLNSRIEEQKKKGRTAGDLYYNTAGEREARNAAERINMSADERRKQFPKSFKSDDYIVFAEEGNVSFSYGVNQQEIDSYVDKAYENKNENDYIKYAKPSLRLKQELNQNVELEGYSHALRDNDIRHIRNSHGEKTNEKYPIKKEDIKKIPYIVENYDKVFYKTNSKGEGGIVYVKVASEDVVYYVEAITTQYHNEKLLINKQMIKTGIDNVPNLHGLLSAINKKQSTAQYLADLKKIRKAYVQDVKEPYSADNSLSKNEKSVKQKQLEIIEKYNPAPNSYSAWVRSESDIKTLEEALMDEENEGYDEFVPDYTRSMVENAIKTGKITVYSSYPIEQGTFVSASKMEAESYSGNKKVYEKEVSINDVAWLDVTQGQYAKVESKQKIAGVKEAEANVERDILLEENKRLRDQIENMHIQLDQAEGKGLDLKKVKELATKLKETYHSTIPIGEIHQELSKIYSSMARKYVDGKEVYSRIYNLASDMVNSAVVKNDEQSMMYADLLDRMRKTRIVVPESERADFPDGYNEYRKHAMGKLTLANSGIDIDSFWEEISKEYPRLLDEDVVGAKAKLDALLEMRNDLQPVYESFFGEDESYISKVKTYLANNIMNGFFKIPEKEGSTKYVFYDKRAAQIEKEAQKALKKAEEQFDKTITRLERKYVKNELKHSIDRDFGFLKNMAENPTNSRHVPQEMQGGVNQMLKLFDYGTKDAESLRESGKQKPKVKGVKLFKLADAYEKIIRDAFGLNGLRDDNNIVADKVLWNELADLRNEINSESAVDGELNSDLDKIIKIEDMNNKQLQTLNKLIKSVHHISVQKNKAFSDNINENIHDLGISVIKESRKVREEKKGKPGRTAEGDRKSWGENKPLRNVLNFLDEVTNYDNLSSYDFFHRIGGTMEKLYGEMRKGFDKHIWNIKKAEEAISKAIGDKDVSKWTGENAKTQKFNLSSGEIELTPAQIMSLYALSKRPAAQEHLLFGGIQVGHGVAKKGLLKKDVASLKVHQLTAEDIAEITSTMSEEQKNLVDDVVKFMSTECAVWGNEASMKLYGYKKFGEKYYFPMNVAKSSLAQSFESKGSKKVQNAGATQTLAKGARNPLVLNDFFDVTAEHIATMSLYNSESLPMLDMERVLNYARWEINETEFGAEREYGATVREEFSRTWGESADRYIKKLMKDINGDRGGESSVWDKFLSNAKKVSVGGNTRVFLQQFTAVSRALNFINPIDFVGAFKKDNTKKMLEHSAIAYWKDLGFYDINVGRTLKSILFEKMPVIDKLTLEPYGWADKATWSSIWGACEHEIKRTTDIPVGSEEFYKKVAEKFDYVIDRSQVVDSVFHRTQSMRSTNSFAKASTAFMSEPLKEINMIRTEILDAVKNKTKMKTLPKVLTIYTASAALVALAQLVPDMVRKEPEDWYDEDEKKKNTKEMWQTEFFENFVESLNPMTKVPFVSDIYEMYKGFTQERFELSSIEDLIESVEKSKDDKKTPWQRVWNVISSLAVFKGIPAKNITREFKSYGAALFRIKDGTEYGDYIVTKLKYNVKNPDNKSKFMKFYTAAVNAGHSEAAVKIMEDYLASNSKDFEKNKDALNAAKKLIKASEKAGEKTLMYELPSKSVSIGEEEYQLEGKEYFDYAETTAEKLWQMALEVTSEEGFSELSSKYQYDALAKAKSYAEALAKQETFSEYELTDWMQKVQEGETSIMQEIQNNIATDEKSRIGKELYQASLESEEKYNEVLKEYEDKFGVDYMIGALTDEMKKTADYKKEPDKYKKQLADDYLIDALIDAAKNSDEYKKDVAEYKKQFTVNTSGLSAYASAEAKKLRAEAATYYANKDNVVNYEGSGSFKKYDDTLSSKMNINDYIVFMAELSEYKNALGKSSLKAAEAVSFINRYSHPREIKRNLFKIVMPKVKKIPY